MNKKVIWMIAIVLIIAAATYYFLRPLPADLTIGEVNVTTKFLGTASTHVVGFNFLNPSPGKPVISESILTYSIQFNISIKNSGEKKAKNITTELVSELGILKAIIDVIKPGEEKIISVKYDSINKQFNSTSYIGATSYTMTPENYKFIAIITTDIYQQVKEQNETNNQMQINFQLNPPPSPQYGNNSAGSTIASILSGASSTTVNPPFYTSSWQALNDACTGKDCIKLDVTNNGGLTLNIMSGQVSLIAGAIGTCSVANTNTLQSWVPGVTKTLIFNCDSSSIFSTNDNIAGNIQISYKSQGSSLTQTTTGTIRATAQ